MKTILLLIAIAGILSLSCGAQKLVYNTDIKKGNVNQWIYADSVIYSVWMFQVDSVNWDGVTLVEEGKWVSTGNGKWYCLKCGLLLTKETYYHNCTRHY